MTATKSYRSLKGDLKAKQADLDAATAELAYQRDQSAAAAELVTTAARAGEPTQSLRADAAIAQQTVQDLEHRVAALTDELAGLAQARDVEDRRRARLRATASDDDPVRAFLGLRLAEMKLDARLKDVRRRLNEPSGEVDRLTRRSNSGMSWMDWAHHEVRSQRLELPGVTSLCDTVEQAQAELDAREAEAAAARSELDALEAAER